MHTTTARAVRRSLIRRGLDPKFPDGFVGHKRGTVRKVTLMREIARMLANKEADDASARI